MSKGIGSVIVATWLLGGVAHAAPDGTASAAAPPAATPVQNVEAPTPPRMLPYAILMPGVLRIPLTSGGPVGFQWGVRGGALMRLSGRARLGLGGVFHHALVQGLAQR